MYIFAACLLIGQESSSWCRGRPLSKWKRDFGEHFPAAMNPIIFRPYDKIPIHYSRDLRFPIPLPVSSNLLPSHRIFCCSSRIFCCHHNRENIFPWLFGNESFIPSIKLLRFWLTRRWNSDFQFRRIVGENVWTSDSHSSGGDDVAISFDPFDEILILSSASTSKFKFDFGFR